MSSNQEPDWLQLLDQSIRAYPASSPKRRRSRIIRNRKSIELAFNFKASLLDQVDAKLVDFVADRVNAKHCLPSDDQPATTCFRCNETQAKQFGRYLAYASTLPMAEPPPKIELGSTPLSTLLTHALLGFKTEYESKLAKQGLPGLEVCLNLLRVVPKTGIDLKDLEKAAVLSKRVVGVVVRHCVDLGWLSLTTLPNRKTPSLVKPTSAGHSMYTRGSRRIRAVERAWLERFGSTFTQLVETLNAITQALELEYPHYISGYGTADEALTGGNYLPVEAGPPRIPARGTEWPVVIRDLAKNTRPKSLPALLSQTLTQFALDYEAASLGRLGLTTLFFKHLPDEGISLADARALQPITGNGKSLHERHMNIVIEIGKPSDGSRHIWPTQKTRRARDAYPFQISEIERQWHRQFGQSKVTKLKRNLQKIVDSLDNGDYPEYPNTTAWILPWSQPYLLKN